MSPYSARRIERRALILAAVLAALSFLLFGPVGGISAAWGATIVLVSFRLWRFLVSRMVERGQGRPVFVIFAGFAKLFVIGWLLWYTVTKTTIDPLAFLLGLSSIVASVFLEGFRSIVVKET